MNSLCGVDCSKCDFNANCNGCEATCGKPFGGTCIAYEYIKVGGKEKYADFKSNLIAEINKVLSENDIPTISALYELNGKFVNLEYTLPNGKKVKFLDDKKIYLGAQIEIDGLDMCYGVVCDTTFILVSSYYENGANPSLILYKQR